MFGRKKSDKPKRDHSGRNLAQYGLFEIPSDLSGVNDPGSLSGDDSDLEAELLQITSGGPTKPLRKPKAKPLPAADLDVLVASSMKEIPSDEDLSGDDDDPDLMDELKELTQDESVMETEAEPENIKSTEDASVSLKTLLEERLKMYETAEDVAKKAGESTRARRFNRGMKTIKDLIKQNNAGRAINPEDIPPEVSANIPKKPPPEPVVNDPIPEPLDPFPIPAPEPDPPVETKTVDQSTVNILTQRRDEYKLAAVKVKRNGDIPTAITYMKIAKQFDVVIKAVENGEQVDLSQMPGSPTVETTPENVGTEKQENDVQHTAEVVEEEEEVQEELITAGSIGEALEQRLQVYKMQEETAKEEGNSGKSRRMGRIVKQFEQAIKFHQAGKPVPFEDLPTPPGYAPIPVNPPAPVPTVGGPSRPAPVPTGSGPSRPAPGPPIPPRTKPAPQSSTADPPLSNKTPPKLVTQTSFNRKMGNQTSNTHLEKQVAMLLARQKEFKNAALEAKKKGEIAQAKELLRTAKGFDKVIDAAMGGFPVDMESLPIPASSRSVLEESFEVILDDECKEDDTGTLEMLGRLEEQLTKQLKMCLSTRDHHKALGDITGVNRFENLALSVTRDLDIVRLAHRRGQDVPSYHYENKVFSIVKCCTDLNDNDVEVSILRGINFNCPNPKDVDTYVKVEFPFPQEETFKERTGVIKDTNNPEYNSVYTIPIQRTSRACLRVFKRHSVKLEVFSRGGFFRSDQLLGTAQIKLQPLETQCELHDSFDLMDGRKKVGGKLEVRIRVRHPLVARQVEQLNEKWLVLNH